MCCSKCVTVTDHCEWLWNSSIAFWPWGNVSITVLVQRWTRYFNWCKSQLFYRYYHRTECLILLSKTQKEGLWIMENSGEHAKETLRVFTERIHSPLSISDTWNLLKMNVLEGINFLNFCDPVSKHFFLLLSYRRLWQRSPRAPWLFSILFQI